MYLTRKVILIVLYALLFGFVDVAFSEDCGNTKEVNISDFVDPSGLPSGRDGPKSLTIDPTLVVFSVNGSPVDPPPMIPVEWQISGGPRMDNLIFYENGNTFKYRILRIDNPIALCDLARGWEAWEKYRQGAGYILYHEAYFVFLKNGEQHILINDLVLTLGPGVSLNEFKNKIFDNELIARENSLGERAGYLEKNVFDANIDSDTGLWKIRVRAADGVFVLRAANRIASYGSYGQPGWISRVDLVFRPLISQVRFTVEFEQLLLSGLAISMQKGEPISVPQLYAPGIRLRVLVDIARDEKGQPLFRLLADAGDYYETLIRSFDPKIEKWQMADMGSGCTKDIVSAPEKKYERTRFSCLFSLLSAGDYQISPLSFRIASILDGKDYVISSGGETLLLRVFTMRHNQQEDGVTGVRPPLKPITSSDISKKQTLVAKPPVSVPIGEPIVNFLKWHLVPYVNAFVEEFLHRPWETIRTKMFLFFLGIAALDILALIIFGRWFKFPSLIMFLAKALWFLFIGILGGIILPMVTSLLGAFGLQFFFRIVSFGKDVKNLTPEVFAGKWHITIPTNPDTLATWALSDKRTMLEQLLAALSVHNFLKSARKEQAIGGNYESVLQLEAVENAGLEAILTPFSAFLIRREMRRREIF